MKPLFAFALVSSLATLVPAAVVRVEVPAHVEWCRTVVVADGSALKTIEVEQALFQETLERIAICARSQGLTGIGIPYLQGTTNRINGSSEAGLSFCAVVAGDAPCAGIELHRTPVTSFLVAVCTSDATPNCKSEVAAALRTEPYNLGGDAIGRIQWRFANMIESSTEAANIAAALTSATGLVLNINAQAANPGGAAQFIVVAAPLPSPVARQQNTK